MSKNQSDLPAENATPENPTPKTATREQRETVRNADAPTQTQKTTTETDPAQGMKVDPPEEINPPRLNREQEAANQKATNPNEDTPGPGPVHRLDTNMVITETPDSPGYGRGQ